MTVTSVQMMVMKPLYAGQGALPLVEVSNNTGI